MQLKNGKVEHVHTNMHKRYRYIHVHVENSLSLWMYYIQVHVHVQLHTVHMYMYILYMCTCYDVQVHVHVPGYIVYLRVAVFLDVHLRKRAHISHSRYIDCEIPEEVHDLWSPGPQTEVQDEWSHQWTYQLINNVHLQ